MEEEEKLDINEEELEAKHETKMQDKKNKTVKLILIPCFNENRKLPKLIRVANSLKRRLKWNKRSLTSMKKNSKQNMKLKVLILKH
jgi:hypothetical protein